MEEKEISVVEPTAINTERLLQARALITNINTGMFMTLNYLKQFRDQGLYVELGFETMEDFCNSGRLIFKWGTAKKFLMVADRLGTGESVKQIADAGSLDVLVTIANDPELLSSYNKEEEIVRLSDGTEIPLKELKAKMESELKEKIKAEDKSDSADLKQKLKTANKEKKDLETRHALLTETQAATQAEAAKWRETASKALEGKVDLDKFALLNTKEGAVKIFVQATEALSGHISLVNEIPTTMEPTDELISLANLFIAELDQIKDRFLDVWNPYFYSSNLPKE